MKPYLVNRLVCPADRQSLTLEVFSETSVELSAENLDKIARLNLKKEDFDKEIMEGVLINNRRKCLYPVFAGVPRLLLVDHPLIAVFSTRFKSKLKPLLEEGYRFDDENSVPGEKNVLHSFSEEWTNYGYNEDVYWGQVTEVYNESLHSTLYSDTQDLKDKLVLEVGIGSGGSCNYMCKKFDCIMIGVDLGYSVDVAFQNFSSNPFMNIVQASAFHLPFMKGSFDFVYSHGVLHHTHSTRNAFSRLADLPKKGGRLYIWVYSPLNEKRNLKRKVIMVLENLIRPWNSRLPNWLQSIVLLPIAPLYIFHQNAVYRGKNGMAKYKWREAMHAARDRFTPRYIYRHTEDEVIRWFGEEGFERIRPLSARQLPDYGPVGFYNNTGVEGFKSKHSF